MRAVVAILLIAALVIAALVVAVMLLRSWRRRRAPWELREESDGETLAVLAVRAGQKTLEVGRVPFGAADFDSRLYEARAEGREKVQALNQNS